MSLSDFLGPLGVDYDSLGSATVLPSLVLLPLSMFWSKRLSYLAITVDDVCDIGPWTLSFRNLAFLHAVYLETEHVLRLLRSKGVILYSGDHGAAEAAVASTVNPGNAVPRPYAASREDGAQGWCEDPKYGYLISRQNSTNTVINTFVYVVEKGDNEGNS